MERLRRWFVFNWWYLRERPPWDTGIAPPELRRFIAAHSPGRALDLGCGTGRSLLELAQAGWEVVGVDFAVKAVRQARRRLQSAGLPGQVILGSVTDLERVMGQFELILDIGCYHSLTVESQAAYRQNLATKIAPLGYYLIYAHCKQENNEPGPGITEADIEKLSDILALVDREDSQDRWERHATWILFQAVDVRTEGS